MLVIILFTIFVSATLLGFAIFPLVYDHMALASERREREFYGGIEAYMSAQRAKKMSKTLAVLPIAIAVICFFSFPVEIRLPMAVLGLAAGFFIPNIYIKFIIRRRKSLFDDQLVDGLMIMSSSFRGGLSLVQAIESVVEEMPSPIKEEFSMVLGENKMGVTLEDALYHLFQRMPSVSLQQMITAILLARETGGNLPVIFSRIVTNIRERKKIQQNLAALTIQGKIQGIVMIFLPIAFAFLVYNSNKRIFMHMLTSNLGRGLLLYCLISEILGAIMIIKISTFKDF